MTRRRLLLIASLPLAVVVIVGVLAMLPRGGVTKANFDRIENGMTKAEIDQIFACDGQWACKGDEGHWSHWMAWDWSQSYVLFRNDHVIEKVWYDSDKTSLWKIGRRTHLDRWIPFD